MPGRVRTGVFSTSGVVLKTSRLQFSRNTNTIPERTAFFPKISPESSNYYCGSWGPLQFCEWDFPNHPMPFSHTGDAGSSPSWWFIFPPYQHDLINSRLFKWKLTTNLERRTEKKIKASSNVRVVHYIALQALICIWKHTQHQKQNFEN